MALCERPPCDNLRGRAPMAKRVSVSAFERSGARSERLRAPEVSVRLLRSAARSSYRRYQIARHPPIRDALALATCSTSGERTRERRRVAAASRFLLPLTHVNYVHSLLRHLRLRLFSARPGLLTLTTTRTRGLRTCRFLYRCRCCHLSPTRRPPSPSPLQLLTHSAENQAATLLYKVVFLCSSESSDSRLRAVSSGIGSGFGSGIGIGMFLLRPSRSSCAQVASFGFGTTQRATAARVAAR